MAALLNSLFFAFTNSFLPKDRVNVGNIIKHGFLMADELDVHFSSVFTREYTSSLSVPETKFNGPEGEITGFNVHVCQTSTCCNL